MQEGFQQNKQKLDKVVSRLWGKHGVNIPSMWDIVRSIKRKKEEPATAIKSKEGEIIEEPAKIRERYLEHFGEILKNVPAETDAEKAQEKLIQEAFSRIISLAEKKETKFTTMEEIQAAVKEMKRKKCKDKTGWNNEIVLETGEEMMECLLALINKMEERREVPKDWNEVKVKTIGKKGSILLMDNKRGLFITDILSKMYEKIVKNRNEEKISDYIKIIRLVE